MDKALHYLALASALWHWFASDAAPYLMATAIPSVITALSASPKAAGAVAFLQKAIRFLGVLTHHDEPGTLKAPLGLGAVYRSLKAALKNAGPAVALFVASVLAAGGCNYAAWSAAHPRAAAALDCVKAYAPAILADVVGALAGGSPDWSTLGRLEAVHGIDAVKCAALKAMEPTAGGAVNPNVARNARAYLDARP